MRTPTSIVALWFIIFFSFLAVACFRWGIREVRAGGNKTILRTCMTLFVVFAVISIIMILSYMDGRFSDY